MKQLPTELDYNNGVGVLQPGQFRISASGLADFFSNTRQWFGDNLLGEKSFSGSQATLLGTCVHFILETYAKHQSFPDHNRQELANYITKCTDPSYANYIEGSDRTRCEFQYKIMGQNAVNNYLQQNMPVCVEPFVATEILPNIFAGGSIDNLTNGQPLTDNSIESLRNTGGMCIVDYKTSSLTPSRLPDTIPFKYRLQLLEYAYVLKQEYNITTDRIRIVYVTTDDCGRISEKTVKPLIDYPSTVIVLSENILPEDMEYISGILHLIAESVHLWQTKPELRHILAHDYRLKQSETTT